MEQLLAIFISAVLINNFVLSQFLGLCTFFGVSKKVAPSIGLGAAVIFVMGCSTTICWLLFKLVLTPLHLEFLKIIVFILVIASFVQLVEIYARKMQPELFRSLGVYLVLTATNCAVLAPPLINARKDYGFLESVANGIGAGLGFALAIILISYIRERLELTDVPRVFEGLPIAFIVTSLMSIAFMGFIGLIRL